MTALLPVSVFLAVLALTAAYLPLGRRLQQLDRPVARSAHARPVVNSGGIAVVGGLLAILLAGHWAGLVVLTSREGGALGLAAVVCAIGAADDRRSLSVQLRLGLFLLASLLLATLYLPKDAGWFYLGILAVALAWLVNAFNFMDGIDGIAALQCALVAAALALLAVLNGADAAYVTVAFSLAGAYTAFLFFNWPPARVFMGDAGSLFAGFCLGWLGLWGVVEAYIGMVPWLLLMSPFLLDTALTLALRVLRRERLTEAHSQHVYQRLARRFDSHQRVDFALCALQCLWLIPLSLACSNALIAATTAMVLGLFPQLLLIAKSASLK